MTTFGAVIISKNDGYGDNQIERTLYSLNSLLRTFDEVIYVDWASDVRPLIEEPELKNGLIDKRNLKYVAVPKRLEEEWVKDYPDHQYVVEVLARNIGLRRLSTEYLISTNPDVITPPKETLERFARDGVFITAGKRTISLYDIRPVCTPQEDVFEKLSNQLGNYGQQPVVGVCDGDVWSLVSGCGDFQMAHRNVWYTIRGFEESLRYRGYADSNVQKKAALAGFEIKVEWEIPVWHIGHGAGGGGYGGWNDVNTALRDFTQTTNPDTWGFYKEKGLVLKKA